MKNELRIEIVLACKIHTKEDEALGGSPKRGGEKKNYERECKSHLIPWVSRRPRYDKTTLLH